MKQYALLLAVSLLGAGGAPGHGQSLDVVPVFAIPLTTNTTATRGAAAPTFTRATVSAGVSATTGLIVEVASGASMHIQPLTVAKQLPVNKAAGIRIGESTVFELDCNNALGGLCWTDVGTPVLEANVTSSPDSTTNADRLTDDITVGLEGKTNNITVPNDSSTWTVTTWTTCASSHTISLGMAFSGGTPLAETYALCTCTTTLTQCSHSRANNGTGNVTLTVGIYPVDATDVGGQQGAAEFSYTQAYNKTYISLLDPATVTAVTVNADVLTYTTLAPTDIGTVCWWAYLRGSDGTGWPIVTWNSTDDLFVEVTGGGGVRISTGSTLVENLLVLTSTTVATDTWTHVCATWNTATGGKVFINGVEASYTTTDTGFTAAGEFGTVIDLGFSGTGKSDQLMSRMKVYNRNLTVAQARRLYRKELGQGAY